MVNLTEALNEFGTKLCGTTIAGTNEQDALNKIAASLSGNTVNYVNWNEALLAMANAINGKSLVTLEEKSVTANGTYTPSSGKAFSKVTVNVA